MFAAVFAEARCSSFRLALHYTEGATHKCGLSLWNLFLSELQISIRPSPPADHEASRRNEAGGNRARELDQDDGGEVGTQLHIDDSSSNCRPRIEPHGGVQPSTQTIHANVVPDLCQKRRSSDIHQLSGFQSFLKSGREGGSVTS